MRAPLIAVIWRSLVKGLAISRSRAVISRRRASSSMRASPVSAFMPRTSAARSFSTTKSTPLSMNAFTGPGHVGARPADHVAHRLAGQVRVLLGAGERELLADDAAG